MARNSGGEYAGKYVGRRAYHCPICGEPVRINRMGTFRCRECGTTADREEAGVMELGYGEQDEGEMACGRCCDGWSVEYA